MNQTIFWQWTLGLLAVLTIIMAWGLFLAWALDQPSVQRRPRLRYCIEIAGLAVPFLVMIAAAMALNA